MREMIDRYQSRITAYATENDSLKTEMRKMEAKLSRLISEKSKEAKIERLAERCARANERLHRLASENERLHELVSDHEQMQREMAEREHRQGSTDLRVSEVMSSTASPAYGSARSGREVIGSPVGGEQSPRSEEMYWENREGDRHEELRRPKREVEETGNRESIQSPNAYGQVMKRRSQSDECDDDRRRYGDYGIEQQPNRQSLNVMDQLPNRYDECEHDRDDNRRRYAGRDVEHTPPDMPQPPGFAGVPPPHHPWRQPQPAPPAHRAYGRVTESPDYYADYAKHRERVPYRGNGTDDCQDNDHYQVIDHEFKDSPGQYSDQHDWRRGGDAPADRTPNHNHCQVINRRATPTPDRTVHGHDTMRYRDSAATQSPERESGSHKPPVFGGGVRSSTPDRRGPDLFSEGSPGKRPRQTGRMRAPPSHPALCDAVFFSEPLPPDDGGLSLMNSGELRRTLGAWEHEYELLSRSLNRRLSPCRGQEGLNNKVQREQDEERYDDLSILICKAKRMLLGIKQ